MRVRTLEVSLLILGLVIFTAGIYFSIISPKPSTMTSKIEPSAGIFKQLDLREGEQVQGIVRVIDGNEGIRVYVEDTLLGVAYNGGTVYTRLEFNFKAQNSGVFRVNFENLSPENQQTIEYSLSFPTDSGIIGNVSIIAGVVLFTISLAMMLARNRKH